MLFAERVIFTELELTVLPYLSLTVHLTDLPAQQSFAVAVMVALFCVFHRVQPEAPTFL